jgi:hypothetical protein
VIVRLEAAGAVVADADDCSAVHLETGLDAAGLRAALLGTGTGTLVEPGDDVVVMDIGVLRSLARLTAPAPDWPRRFAEMVASAGDRLTGDGLGLRLPVERPAG